MKRYFALFVAVLLATAPSFSSAQSTQPAGPAEPAAPPALRQSVDLTLQAIDHAQTLLPDIVRAAEAVAKRWIEGAQLFVAGDESFSDEAFYRAGGLIGLRRVAQHKLKFNGRQVRWDDVPENSIILFGIHRNIDPNMQIIEDFRHLAYEGHTVVFFGSGRWTTSQVIVKRLQRKLSASKVFFIDTDLPADTSLSATTGQRYGDYAPIATAVHMWAFTAELISACTRQGKTPAIWPSGSIPRFEVWEKKYEDTTFHTDLTVKPIPPGALLREYFRILRHQVQSCLDAGPQLQTAAAMLANVPADKAVFAMIESHLMAQESYLPPNLTNWVLVQRGWRWREAVPLVEPGDAIFWLGYIEYPDGAVKRALQQKNPFVACSVRAPGTHIKDEPLLTPTAPAQPIPPILRDSVRELANGPSQKDQTPPTLPPGVVWLHAPWEYPDAVVMIPGYPLPACPTSGIVQGTLLWALIGQILDCPPSEPAPVS